jgi:uncharacterized protein YqgC (DUF456 family)
MPWLYYILMLIVMLCGMFISIVGLPGIWIMVLAVAGFAWATRAHQFVSPAWLIALAVIAGISEIVELVAGSAGAKKAGGSKRAMIGAIIGALLGGFFFTFIPIPIVSTIVGVCLGAFVGAAIVELAIFQDVDRSLRVGVGAAKGRFFGIVSKLIFCVIIFLVAIFIAFPVGGISATTPPMPAMPATAPTTFPTTQ